MSPAGAAQCPRCQWRVAQRAPRTGIVERLISLVSVYPFRCQVCRHRFLGWRPGIRDSGSPDDRREYTRADVRLPAVVSFHGLRAPGELTNLSVTGATLQSDFGAAEGALVQLEIELPDGQVVAVDGALVRSVRGGSLGLEFTTVRVPERARLQAFLIGDLGLAES